ncbi:MAG: diphthine--ammonia ligase [Nanoarchaeota archaeon]|nr:diphthine--ammonia ligase [Nanoarchaeota archaeon]
MCGIIGSVEIKRDVLSKALNTIKYRGKDHQAIAAQNKVVFGHCLHAVVGIIPQPLKEKGLFTSNCEIYNWKDLAEQHHIKAKNDADLIFKLLEKDISIKTIINQLDGVFAFAYHHNNTITLARDLFGVKPLWYTKTPFAFASEKKALESIALKDITELNPRTILQYNTKTKKIKELKIPFLKIQPEIKKSKKVIIETTKKLLIQTVNKRIPDKKLGLLFSGGLDSSLLALLLKKAKKPFTCYVAAYDDPAIQTPEDLVEAKKAAKKLNLKLKVIKINLMEVEKNLKTIIPLIEDSNVVKVAVALTFHKAIEQAKKDGCKVIFSGLGAEELFAGYQRHKNAININKECLSGLLNIYERDLYRDDVMTMYHSVELRLPFLDKELANYALKIPQKYKIQKGREKAILRDVAIQLKLPKEIAERPKKAAQYGSRFQKSLQKLTKQHRYEKISEYLDTFLPNKNPKLAALLSTGKDSLFAIHTMIKQNYPIKCLITINSENKDSYMFHTPTIELAKLQAKAMNLPLIVVKTKGNKESELKDLISAIKQAKTKYNIEGIVSGALYSTYQRDRIQKITESLQLKNFNPLWHINQEAYLQDLLKANFNIIISKVAADGLDRSWLGKTLNPTLIKGLKKLHKINKIHLTGEGGEFETLVLDCPLFTKKIKIRAKKEMESQHVGHLGIKKASLESK